MAYIYDLSDTWNAGGTTFYGIKMNVTNSASAAGSKLLSLQVSGSELFGVDKNGNVGIGTASPGAKLDVAGSVWVRPGGASGAVADLTADAASGTNGISLAAGFASGGYGPIKLLTSATERMRIDSTGNVGIGTSAANARLSLGNLVSNKVFALYDDGTNQYGMGIAGSQYRLFGATGANICFGNYARGTDTFTETARIDGSGNLLVGTTTAAGTLTVNAPATTTAAYIQNQTTTTWTTRIANTGATGDNLLVLFETDTGSQRGSITYNRGAGLIQFNTTSDYRAKTIHGPVGDVGSVVDALKVYDGTMHGATQSRPMLVAHEAQEVAPYAVFGEKDALNPDGTPAYQSIDVSALVPLLIAEIQSLRARVAQLEGN